MRLFLTLPGILLSILGYSQSNIPVTNSAQHPPEKQEERVLQDTLLETTPDQEDRKELPSVQRQSSQKSKKSIQAEIESSSEEGDANSIISGSSAVQQISVELEEAQGAISTKRTSRSPSVQEKKYVEQLVKNLEDVSPESFEYHYFKYASSNHDTLLIEHLEQAEMLRPENSDVTAQFAAYSVITGQSDKAISYLSKLEASGRLEKVVIDYTEDILQSTPANGILVTHGFDDSYGVSYNQHVKSIRKDVQLASLEWLKSPAYRSSLKNANVVIPDREQVDTTFLRLFCEQNINRNTVISLTTPKEYLNPIRQKLYIRGLVMQYTEIQPFMMFNVNENLWYETLRKSVQNMPASSKGNRLSTNYLPMLFAMRSYYSARGYLEKLREIDQVIDQIGMKTGTYQQVNELKKKP
jgi:hypothetical protein